MLISPTIWFNISFVCASLVPTPAILFVRSMSSCSAAVNERLLYGRSRMWTPMTNTFMGLVVICWTLEFLFLFFLIFRTLR